MPLVAKSAPPWHRTAGWLVPGVEYKTPGANCTWLEYATVRCVLTDDGIMEQPIGSNRGTRIDTMVKRVPMKVVKVVETGEGHYWCGVEAGDVFRRVGSMVPAQYPAVRDWLEHAVDTPRPGSAVAYRSTKGQHHIEIVTRVGTGLGSYGGLLTCGGNRGYGGSATNNGVCVDQAPMTRDDVVGFIRPQPVPGWTLVDFVPAHFLLEHFGILPKPERKRALEKIHAHLPLALTAT